MTVLSSLYQHERKKIGNSQQKKRFMLLHCTMACCIISLMSKEEFESLGDYLRSLAIENFVFDGSRVRIGSRHWLAQRCSCDRDGCDGWGLVSLDGQRLPAFATLAGQSAAGAPVLNVQRDK